MHVNIHKSNTYSSTISIIFQFWLQPWWQLLLVLFATSKQSNNKSCWFLYSCLYWKIKHTFCINVIVHRSSSNCTGEKMGWPTGKQKEQCRLGEQKEQQNQPEQVIKKEAHSVKKESTGGWLLCSGSWVEVRWGAISLAIIVTLAVCPSSGAIKSVALEKQGVYLFMIKSLWTEPERAAEWKNAAWISVVFNSAVLLFSGSFLHNTSTSWFTAKQHLTVETLHVVT